LFNASSFLRSTGQRRLLQRSIGGSSRGDPPRAPDYGGDLPTARTTLRTKYVRVLVFCNSCHHQADADLQKIVDAGRGDMPLTELRFRCSQCGSQCCTDRTDFVVTSHDNPQPW
jgi:hypothetical protein